MADPISFIDEIERNRATIRDVLGPDAASAFEARYHELVDQWHAQPESRGYIAEQLLVLVRSYPAIVQVLREAAPTLFDSPASVLSPKPAQARVTVTLPGEPPPAGLDHPVATTPQPASEQLPLPSTQHSTPKKESTQMPTPPSLSQSRQSSDRWTPEQIVHAFKEVLTGVLALLLVFYTLRIAQQTFALAGDQQKISDAKDVLLLMLGLAGVVIGYYFGRVPADARAAQAQQQAIAATAQVEQINAKAQQVAERIDEVVTRIAVNGVAARRGGPGGEEDEALADELQRVRDDVRELLSVARRW